MTEDQLMGQAIEWWISGPFHRPELLSPQLLRAGFGQYCEGPGCVSAVNVVSDLVLAPPGGESARGTDQDSSGRGDGQGAAIRW